MKRVFLSHCGGRQSSPTLVVHLEGGRGGEPRAAGSRGGDVRRSHAEVSAAARDLGFRPRVSVEQGLRLMLDRYGR